MDYNKKNNKSKRIWIKKEKKQKQPKIIYRDRVIYKESKKESWLDSFCDIFPD